MPTKRIGDHDLPEYYALPAKRAGKSNPPTLGIATIDGKNVKVMSGDGVPGLEFKDLIPKTEHGVRPWTHVETHVAAMMRKGDTGDVTLSINKPGGLCSGCQRNVPKILPEGKTLTIIHPDITGTKIMKTICQGGKECLTSKFE